MSFELNQSVQILPAVPDQEPVRGTVIAKRDLRGVEFYLVRHFHSVSQAEKWFQAHELSAG